MSQSNIDCFVFSKPPADQILPVGEYDVRVNKVSPCQSKFSQCSVMIQYQVVRGPHEGQLIAEWLNFNPPLSIKSKIARKVQALGLQIIPDQGIPFSSLENRQAIATVIIKHGTDGSPKNKISELRHV